MHKLQGDFIRHDLFAVDVDAAARFYAGLLGWQCDAADDAQHGYQIRNSLGACVGCITEYRQGAVDGLQPGWVSYVAVDDVDQVLARVIASGGRQVIAPRDETAGQRVAVAADPQGALFGLVEATSTGARHGLESAPLGYCLMSELTTNAPADARKFFHELFGWGEGKVVSMGLAGDYVQLLNGDEVIGAIAPQQQAPRPMWILYFKASDPDLAAAAIVAAGGRIFYGPAVDPDGSHTIVARDSQKALFALSNQALLIPLNQRGIA